MQPGSSSMVATAEEPHGAEPVRTNLVDRMMHADVARQLFGAVEADDARIGIAATAGRFVILDRIGAGGMATVYRAYDPELHRRIALKVLLPSAEEQLARRERFRREALALAQLAHPNVVTIYEVGVFGGELFIAMEYVEGVDLMRWLRDNPIGGQARFERALDLLRQAGLGLAAAHAVGLVHRDFKPSNVLIGEDGRVKVADFGLARTGDEQPSENASGPTSSGELTRTGTTLGTPRYMPPEQQRGSIVDARTDQFSFCVAAWEVLFGAPPWRGLPDPEEPPTAPAWAPKWLRAVLARGLAAEPANRWEDMRALLAALRRGQPRRRARNFAVGVALLAAGGGGAIYARDRVEAGRVAACEAEGATIDDVWSDARHPELRAAMLGSGLAFAEASTETTLDYLDAYAAAWAEARTEACSRRDVTQQWDADTAERAQWCLAQARDELDVLADELRRGEPTVVRESVRLSAGLIRFDACLDALALRRLPVPPSEQQESVRAVRRELARARAVSELGRPVDALSIARQCLADSEALGWPPLDAAARTRVGKLLETTGDSAQAETELEAAYFIAVKAHAYSEASIAAEGLVYTVGVTLDRHEEGLRWARHAEVMREQLPDPEGIRLAAALTNRASVHSARGELERSRALQEEALALFERAVGPDHPLVGGSLHSLAAIATWQGDYARSLRLGERALANREHVLGPDHPEVATTRIGLAGVYYTLGDSDRARVTVEAGLSSLERALGPDHPDLARGLGLIGALHKSEGAYAEARIAFERALRINETAFGSEHPDVALALDNVALVAQLDGDFDGARRMYERSRSIVEQRLGPEHVAIAYPLLGLCEVALAQGRTADAVALAQRAVDVRDAGSPASERAHARFTLARAQWATGTDRERAIQAAQTALEMYRSSAGDEAQAIAQIEAWLSEHTLGGAQNSDN